MTLTYNTLVVLAGAGLLGLLCGAVGCFAVLRQRALLGDVLAHAALPGLATAFLLFSSKSLPILLAGSMASGLLGLGALSFIRRQTRTKDDAAMALILASMFGIGVSLSRIVQNRATDASHAGLDSFILGKTAGMILSDVFLMAAVSLVALAAIALLFKEFRLVSFDPSFAQSLGWPVPAVDYGILALLALAVVLGLPMVGVVMIAALTIIPPVTARLWVTSLRSMVLLSSAIGIVSAVAGVLVSARFEGMPTGPVIVLCAAVLFTASALFSPHRGIIATRMRRNRLADERALEVLKRTVVGPSSTSELARSLRKAGVLRPRPTIALAGREGVLRIANGRVELRPGGRNVD